MNVLITGGTGFLGAATVKKLVENKTNPFVLIRDSSNLNRIKDVISEVQLIKNEQLESIKDKIDVIIHFAWMGVSAEERSSFEYQLKNIILLNDLLQFAKRNNGIRFIGIGSQAECGFYQGPILENHPIKFDNAYGSAKNIAFSFMKNFCEQNKVEWNWLRLFSFYGKGEDPNWFLPWMIRTIKKGDELNMSPGDQRYCYMHIEDLATIIFKIINNSNTVNKIYNVCSENEHSLKEIVNHVESQLGISNSKIRFGALPYRDQQVMIMKGDVSRLKKDLNLTTLEEKNFFTEINKIIHE